MTIKAFLDSYSTLPKEEKLKICKSISENILSQASNDHLLAEQNKYFATKDIREIKNMEEYQVSLIDGILNCLRIEMTDEGAKLRAEMGLGTIFESMEIPND